MEFIGDKLMKLAHIMLLSALLIVGKVVYAAEDRNYHMGFCEVDTSSTFYSSNFFKSIGAIYNNSTTQEMRVVCPIMRVLQGTTVASVVSVVDYHSTIDASCYLYAVQSSGTGASGRVAYSSGASATYQEVNIAAIPASGTPWRDAYLYCIIPRRDGFNTSKFLRYRITEN